MHVLSFQKQKNHDYGYLMMYIVCAYNHKPIVAPTFHLYCGALFTTLKYIGIMTGRIFSLWVTKYGNEGTI
jgi:hypothetical protein